MKKIFFLSLLFSAVTFNLEASKGHEGPSKAYPSKAYRKKAAKAYKKELRRKGVSRSKAKKMAAELINHEGWERVKGSPCKKISMKKKFFGAACIAMGVFFLRKGKELFNSLKKDSEDHFLKSLESFNLDFEKDEPSYFLVEEETDEIMQFFHEDLWEELYEIYGIAACWNVNLGGEVFPVCKNLLLEEAEEEILEDPIEITISSQKEKKPEPTKGYYSRCWSFLGTIHCECF